MVKTKDKPKKDKKANKSKNKKDKVKKIKPPRITEAERADRYDCYQRSVQVPEEDVKFMNGIFKKRFGVNPRILREDFCGTALASCEWVKCHPDNVAYGVDIDPDPLDWGRRHNLTRLGEAQRQRVHLIEGNALDGGTPRADIVAGLNFSYFCFTEREQLLRYLGTARDNIKDQGLLVLDMEGGWEALDDAEEEREEDGFTYIWIQEDFNAITHGVKCAISFEFEDGSRLERAFSYEWRIWTMPELRDALHEVGFRTVEAYWEGWDEELEEGDGVFTLADHAENCESWIAYLIAVKE